jgi:hypothetical protein
MKAFRLVTLLSFLVMVAVGGVSAQAPTVKIGYINLHGDSGSVTP